MENNLFASIVDTDAFVHNVDASSKRRQLISEASQRYQDEASLTSSPSSSSSSSLLLPSSSTSAAIVNAQLLAEQANKREFHFAMSILNAELIAIKNMLSTTSYVVYQLAMLRVNTGEYFVVNKRYSEIAEFVEQLNATGDIRDLPSIPFPTRTLGSDSSAFDVNSDFIRGRKAALEEFLRNLFYKNSHLLLRMESAQFFELSSFQDIEEVKRFVPSGGVML